MGSNRSFTTDDLGNLPRDVQLRPDTTYEVARRPPPPAGKLPSKEYLLSWVRGAVLGDLRTLRAGMATYEKDLASRAEQRLAGGNFLLAAGCCMALEYVARVFHGSDDPTENLRAYAAKFLTSRYTEVADLLWRSFRNGIVHGSWPQPICNAVDLEDRVRVAAGVDASTPHLESVEGPSGQTFVVNSVQLLADLEESVDAFAEWLIDAPDVVLERGAPRLLVIKPGDTFGQAQLQRLRDGSASD